MSERDWGKCIVCSGFAWKWVKLSSKTPPGEMVYLIEGEKFTREACEECGGTGFNGLLDPHRINDLFLDDTAKKMQRTILRKGSVK